MKSSIVDQSQKLRGGYYTPPDIVCAIVEKIINVPGEKILEPSFGDGVFISEAIKRKLSLGENIANIKKSITGIELDFDEYNKLASHIKDDYSVNFPNLFCEDFFAWFDRKNNNFDIVIGNPPFIRYQSFPEPARTRALDYSLMEGVRLNKLTNIWVPFVILSTALLKEKGHLGMVVPAELLQVSYAGPLRKYLLDSFETIVLFTCNELLFAGAEQETIVLLAVNRKQKDDKPGIIQVVETGTKDALINAIKNHTINTPGTNKTRKNIPLHSGEKWTKYFLKNDDIRFIQSLEKDDRVIPFKKLFSVDVGIVTGKNDYFVITRETALKYNLFEFVKPAVCRSYQIRDEIFCFKDWKTLWEKGEAVGLLDFNNFDGHIPVNVKNYLEYGTYNYVHTGYKCSARKDWYKVPSIWIPDAFMFRQIHDFPHLVLNHAKAVSTDTIHRVKQNENVKFNQVLFYTYLTAVSAEIEGRSYGGGVLELEPSEAEKLLIPNPQYIDFKQLDYPVSRKENGKFLRENSYFILNKFLNFSNNEIARLENVCNKLFNRRTSRRKN
jgi:adenine-specific DNA methylase